MKTGMVFMCAQDFCLHSSFLAYQPCRFSASRSLYIDSCLLL